jgi:hypothetical protein
MANHLVEVASRDGDVTNLNITDETEWDLKAWVQKIHAAQGFGLLVLPDKLFIRHYDDGVWEILDQNMTPIISGTVNDRGLKR